MHIDARELDNNTLIEGDICIIGAGAAGISMALDWDKTNQKVILLEGGGFEYDAKLQELYEGKNIGQKYLPLSAIRLHKFGGTTGLWGGFCSPFDDIDFVERKWVEHSGWPISLKDLVPFYNQAMDILDLHSTDYSLDYWQKREPSYENLPFNNHIIHEKIWQFSPPTRFGKKYKDDVVNSRNIELYTYANVTNIAAIESMKEIDKLEIKNHAGKKHFVKAKYYILACGAIQNARILLTSNKQNIKGLGNENDLVGRYFMEHVEVKSSEIWLNSDYDMSLYLLRKGTTKARAELAISNEAQEKYKILNGTVSLRPLDIARHAVTINENWKDGNPYLKKEDKSLMERIKKKYLKMKEGRIDNIQRAFQLHTRIEQAPNPNSRILLDNKKDALGMNLVNLNWQLSDIDKDSIRTIYNIIGQQVGVSDIGRIKLMEFLREKDDKSWPEFTSGGFHHMGTTRMNNDPKKGVVDSTCKLHGIDNLFVAGSSCFTTSGASNPTFTLIALSLRLSNYLKSKFN